MQGLQAAPFAYIAEALADNVSVIDTATHRVVAKIPVGRSPMSVGIDPAGTRVYVANNGADTVSVIDATTNTVIASIAVGRNPRYVVVGRAGERVYVANESDDTVSVIDPRTRAVVGSILVGPHPSWLALSPEGERLYVANGAGISVIDTAAQRLVATLIVGKMSSVAVDPQGHRLYAVFSGSPYGRGFIFAIDASTGEILDETTLDPGSFTIALNPAGTRAYVANQGTEDSGGDTISVIDTASFAVVGKVYVVGGPPIGISVNPSGTRLYAAVFNVHLALLTGMFSRADYVAVIDTATNAVIDTIPVGGEPLSFGHFIGPANVVLDSKDNYQGLWWNSPAGSESGWGVNLTHQGDTLFATWFTYDTDGSGLWLVMSNGTKTGEATYSGTLSRHTGPWFHAVPWDPSVVTSNVVGNASFAFADADNGTFAYTVNGITRSKAITRYQFAGASTTCTAGGLAGRTPSYQDLWWRAPAGSESGWGVSLAHQGDTLFATWFTYDASGKGQWFSMSNGVRTGTGTYSGALHRTSGPAFDASSWNSTPVRAELVGSATFSFGQDPDNAIFSYTLEGVSASQPITRYRFSSPATVCR
jgi:YVTN family beta-propeller protein